MMRILELLRDVKESSDYGFLETESRTKAKVAVTKGIPCILRTQLKQFGKLTAWFAENDEKTLEPAWARSYEPRSISGAESVGVVQFLMSVDIIHDRRSSPLLREPLGGSEIPKFRCISLETLTDAEGQKDKRVVADPDAGPLWARFYEIGNNRPIFLDRDSVVRYTFSEIGQERRTVYAYYGS